MKETIKQNKMNNGILKGLIPIGRNSRAIFIAIGLFFILANLLIIFTTKSGIIFSGYNLADYKLNEPAADDFIPDRDIHGINEAATEQERERAAQNVPLVFRRDNEKSEDVISDFDKIREGITSDGRHILYENLGVSEIIDDETLDFIKSYEEAETLLNITGSLISEIMNQGMVSFKGIDKDIFDIDYIIIIKESKKQEFPQPVDLSEVISARSLPAWLESRLETIALKDPSARQFIITLVSAVVEENVFFDQNQTEIDRNRAREERSIIYYTFQKDIPIIRKGEIINQEHLAKIQAYLEYSLRDSVYNIAGTIIYLFLLFLLTLFLLYQATRSQSLQREEIIILMVIGITYLLLSIIFLSIIPTEWFPLSLILPTALVAILITIMISANIGIIITLSLSLLLYAIHPYISTFIFAFVSGLAGIAVVYKASRRIDLIKAAFILSLINTAIICALAFLEYAELKNFLVDLVVRLAWAAGNGFFCGILSLGFLPILENWLNTPTRFRLMELSDINVPILKRMITLAPGTYNHSLNVANLAESACEEIGANALLARVGAYYHDIGKLDQPEYFIENQSAYNKHDNLKPSLSVAVIKSHVKVGVEKAKELNLPQAVIDIITQHHGKGLITYFYNRALKDKSKISQRDYSYPGVKPRTKEAAVVMLADAVEAASRTLKRPTVAKIEKLVWSLIVDKFNTGELSECNVTFKDLEIIKKSFVNIIAGYFHQRIEYPKLKEASV